MAHAEFGRDRLAQAHPGLTKPFETEPANREKIRDISRARRACPAAVPWLTRLPTG
jgi:hypothetical protein